MWYMVWGSQKRPKGFMGATYLDWSQPPLGVYAGDDPDEACKAAMVDHGTLNTFFAVEGFVWGIALMDQDKVNKLGATGTPMDKVALMLERAEERDAEITRLLLEKGRNDADT